MSTGKSKSSVPRMTTGRGRPPSRPPRKVEVDQDNDSGDATPPPSHVAFSREEQRKATTSSASRGDSQARRHKETVSSLPVTVKYSPVKLRPNSPHKSTGETVIELTDSEDEFVDAGALVDPTDSDYPEKKVHSSIRTLKKSAPSAPPLKTRRMAATTSADPHDNMEDEFERPARESPDWMDIDDSVGSEHEVDLPMTPQKTRHRGTATLLASRSASPSKRVRRRSPDSDVVPSDEDDRQVYDTESPDRSPRKRARRARSVDSGGDEPPSSVASPDKRSRSGKGKQVVGRTYSDEESPSAKTSHKKSIQRPSSSSDRLLSPYKARRDLLPADSNDDDPHSVPVKSKRSRKGHTEVEPEFEEEERSSPAKASRSNKVKRATQVESDEDVMQFNRSSLATPSPSKKRVAFSSSALDGSADERGSQHKFKPVLDSPRKPLPSRRSEKSSEARPGPSGSLGPSTVYLSDLTELVVRSLPEQCGVDDPSAHDRLLESLGAYDEMHPLEAGGHVKAAKEYGSNNEMDELPFETWENIAPSVDIPTAARAIVFEQDDRYINLCRVNPLALVGRPLQTTGRWDVSIRNSSGLLTTAICVLPLAIRESNTRTPNDKTHRHNVSGIFHAGEWARYSAVLRMLVNNDEVFTHIYNNSLSCTTWGSTAAPAARNDRLSSYLVRSASSPATTLGRFVGPLSTTTQIPVYDGRGKDLEFTADFFNNLPNTLPRYQGEVPESALAIVGYVLQFETQAGGSYCYNHYVRWVILIGEVA